MQTIEQLKNLTGGYIPSKMNGTEYTYRAITTNSRKKEELPVSFRLWTSGVKNQVDKGTCVAHTLAALKETQDYYDTKSVEKYSTAWIYLVREMNQYKGEGMMIKEAMANLKNIGVVPYSMLPGNVEYDDGALMGYKASVNEEMKEEAKKHRIESYVFSTNKDDIKKALYHDHSPVAIGVYVYESFYDTDSSGIVPIPDEQRENIYGGHAMLIIGWINIANKEYWVVQNSWGETWGDNGYCYLEIDKFPINEMWASIDLADYPCELTDISEHWAKDYIEKCVRAGLINGFEDNTFKPDEPLTRAQMSTIIWKMLDKVTK
jgi:C1A family cysteine protease